MPYNCQSFINTRILWKLTLFNWLVVSEMQSRQQEAQKVMGKHCKLRDLCFTQYLYTLSQKHSAVHCISQLPDNFSLICQLLNQRQENKTGYRLKGTWRGLMIWMFLFVFSATGSAEDRQPLPPPLPPHIPHKQSDCKAPASDWLTSLCISLNPLFPHYRQQNRLKYASPPRLTTQHHPLHPSTLPVCL